MSDLNGLTGQHFPWGADHNLCMQQEQERFHRDLPMNLEGLRTVILDVASCMDTYPTFTGCSDVVGVISLASVIDTHTDTKRGLAMRVNLAVRFVKRYRQHIPVNLAEIVESLPELFQPWIDAAHHEIVEAERQRRILRDKLYAQRYRDKKRKIAQEQAEKQIAKQRRQWASDFVAGKLTKEEYKRLLES